MNGQSTQVLVASVGMSNANQQMIEAQCLSRGGIEFRQYSRWSFELLHAQALVIDMDSGLGKEALNMLKSFRLKDSATSPGPRVLYFSADDFQATGWTQGLDAITKIHYEQQAEFCAHLGEVLATLTHESVERTRVQTPINLSHSGS